MESNADNSMVKHCDEHLNARDEPQQLTVVSDKPLENVQASSEDDTPSSVQIAKNSAGNIEKSIDNAPADAGLGTDDNKETATAGTAHIDDRSSMSTTRENTRLESLRPDTLATEPAMMTESAVCTNHDDHVSQTFGESVQPSTEMPSEEKDANGPPAPLTEATLAEQNKQQEKDGFDNTASAMSTNSAIRAWAATLPEVPDSVKETNVGPAHIFEIQPTKEEEEKAASKDEPRVQETKDVFTDTQKIAYVGLCALTSLEVVHDFEGKDFTYARMSAGNWQRKLMRMLYAHMDISDEEIKMIESLSTHRILPTDLVHQFVAQGETTIVDMAGFHKVRQSTSKPRFSQKSSSTLNNDRLSESNSDASSTKGRGSISSNQSDKTERMSKGSTSPHTTPSSTCDEKDDQFIIDLRWTVMCDLLLLCLSLESYDARSRVFIARMASYLSLDWFQVIKFEKRIAEHLLQDAGLAWETETVTSVATTQTSATDLEVTVRNDAERESRNRQGRKRRYVMIGLATIGGGLILGLSAGLMAPVIAGGIGTILTTVGVTGTSGFLGGTAGIALITGGATVTGGGLGAKSMKKRMKTINTFEFSQVNADDNVSCIVTIAGWLPKGGGKDAAALPFSVLDPVMGDHYSLFWEPEMLEALGSAFKIFATEVVAFSIQQALTHTIMGALLAGLAWPLALTKLGYLVDNPWNNGLDRARLAGLILADSLMNRNLGARPVTLVGYSLGARVIFFCLLELARVNAYGLVENVALFGTPVSASKSQWKECTTVVSGRFINGYATSDWLLGFLFRASTAGLGNVAGLRALEHIEGNRVQNIDCTDLVKGHLNYRTAMPKLLKRAGFVVTSDELPSFVKEKETDKDVELDLSGADDLKTCRPATMAKGTSVSSLSSGKASIQYPPPKPRSASPTSISSPAQPTINDNSIQPDNSDDEKSHSTSQSHGGSIDPSVAAPAKDTQVSKAPPPMISSSKAIASDNTATDTSSMSDQDVIADILAKAAAVSKSSGKKYSSLSSGRASIQARTASPKQSMSESTRLSESERNSSPSIDEGNTISRSTSFIFSKRSSFFKGKKKSEFADDDSAQRELSEAGVEVKEIKSTLGRMVVPDDVVNPMPKISLEKPQYARINR